MSNVPDQDDPVLEVKVGVIVDYDVIILCFGQNYDYNTFCTSFSKIFA